MPLANRTPALLRLAQRLEARADADPEFRALLLDLSDALAEIAGPGLFEGDPAALDPADDEAPRTARPPDRPDTHDPDADALLDLAAHFRDGDHIGRVENHTALNEAASAPEPDPRLADRLDLKAAAARHVADRLRDAGAPRGDGAPFDLDRNLLLARAERFRHCSLWMLSEPLRSPDAAETLAHAYSSAADAARLIAAFGTAAPTPGSSHNAALMAAAEAQSALRSAVRAARADGGPAEDPDQFALFRAIRDAIHGTDVYIARHLRLDDPADPSGLDVLDARLAHLSTSAPVPEEQSPAAAADRPAPAGRRDKLLKAVADRAGRIERGDGSPEANWPRLLSDLTKAVRAGLPESAVELRDALLPILDTWPTDAAAPAEAARVRREIERYVASRPEEEEDGDDPFTDEVAAVAAQLDGRTIALFGGVSKPHVAERIARAFGVQVRWEETRPHQSTEPFRAAVAQPDVALAVLFIRWCSHSFEDLKAYCEAAGVPYVRVKAGNHPNRLARAILAQVGQRIAS